MAYVSLYRKYRSQTFDEVSGQDHVTRTLQNAIRSDKVAHAYLFCGPRGTGKTSTARLLAKALNCETGPTPEPCNICSACTQITEGRFLDMKEIDAASNRGIDEIRDLRDNVAYAPVHGRYKVYVIDEAHQITGDAFNAFLKTLEEPPPHVVFIMATTEAHKIPATIVSRCQRFEFRRASLDHLRERVAWVAEQEGATVDVGALDLIARDANGGWRDALSLLEQVLSFSDGTVTARDVYTVLGTVEADSLYAIAGAIATGDGAAVFRLLGELIAEGKDPRQLLRDLTGYYRTLMLTAAGSPPPGDPEQAQRIAAQAALYGSARLIGAIEVLAQAEREARWSESPRLLVELSVCRMMHPRSAPDAARPMAADMKSAPAAAVRPAEPPRRVAAPAPGANGPFVDETPAPVTVDRYANEPPMPLTVGDARIGGRDDDDDGSIFDSIAPPPAPAHTAPPPNPARQSTAPTPPSVPTAPPVVPAGDQASSALDVDRVVAKWTVIREELKRDRKMNVYMFLVDAVPDRFERDELVIRLPYTGMVEEFGRRGKDFSEPVIQAIQRVTGIACRIRAEVGKGGKGSPTSSGGRSAPAAPSRTMPAVPTPSNAPSAPSGSLNLSPSNAARAAVGAPSNGEVTPPGAVTGTDLIHNVIEVLEGQIVDDREG